MKIHLCHFEIRLLHNKIEILKNGSENFPNPQYVTVNVDTDENQSPVPSKTFSNKVVSTSKDHSELR